jgi:hypothetical protein
MFGGVERILETLAGASTSGPLHLHSRSASKAVSRGPSPLEAHR